MLWQYKRYPPEINIINLKNTIMTNFNLSEIDITVNNIINSMMDGAQNGVKSVMFDSVIKESEQLYSQAKEILSTSSDKKELAFANILTAISYLGKSCRDRKIYTRKKVYACMAETMRTAYEKHSFYFA